MGIDLGKEYLLSGDFVKRTFIGSLLILTYQLIIPVFFLLGYSIDVFRNTKNGNSKPPEFSRDKLGQYVNDGLAGMIILFLHSIAVSIPVSALIYFLVEYRMLSLPLEAAGGAVLILFALWLLLSFIIGSFTVPASFGIYVYRDSMKSAISPRRVAEIVFSKDYILVFLVSIILLAPIAVIPLYLLVIRSSIVLALLPLIPPTLFSVLVLIMRKYAVAAEKQLTEVRN